jgi:hypothetical protein
MIKLKNILLEAMKPSQAVAIFAKYGIRNAGHLDKIQLNKYFRALAKKHHSDVGGQDEQMKWINAAYDILKRDAKDVIDVELKPEDKIVNVEFRTQNDEEVLDTGHCNHSEFTEMMNKIQEEGISVIVIPPDNYDNIEEKWLVPAIIIYMAADDFYTVSFYIEPFFKH